MICLFLLLTASIVANVQFTNCGLPTSNDVNLNYTTISDDKYILVTLSTESKNWLFAKQFCVDSGFGFASIHTNQDSISIRTLLVRSRIEIKECWIGLSYPNCGSTSKENFGALCNWKWADGSINNFSYWGKYSKDQEIHRAPIYGQNRCCVSTEGGSNPFWINDNCIGGSGRKCFVCQKVHESVDSKSRVASLKQTIGQLRSALIIVILCFSMVLIVCFAVIRWYFHIDGQQCRHSSQYFLRWITGN